MIAVRARPPVPVRLVCGAATLLSIALPVMAALFALPRFLTESRAFTLLFTATTLALLWREAHKRWRPLRIWPYAVALPVLALLDTAAFVHLDAPFWVAADTTAFCAGAGAGAPACRRPGEQAAAAPPTRGPSVQIVGQGWHTSLVIETADLDASLWPFAAELQRHKRVDLGWGDAQFYQADHPTVAMAIGALILPGPSVLHVYPFDAETAATFHEGTIIRLPILDRAALTRFVAGTFHMGADGRPVITSPGDNGPESHYVQANGSYHFPVTCNVWTARALAAGGVPLSPAFAITSRNLLAQASAVGFVER